MNWIIGIGLGMMSVIIPNTFLSVGIIASTQSVEAVLGCFAVQFTLGTLRMVETPNLTGLPILTAVWDNNPRNRSTESCMLVSAGRLALFIFGLLVAFLLVSLMGMVRIPPVMNHLMIGGVVFWALGGMLIFKDPKRRIAVGCLVIVAVLVKLMSGFGSQIVLALLLALTESAIDTPQPRTEAEPQMTHLGLAWAGIASGLTPGLSTATLIEFFASGEFMFRTFLAEGSAEGYALGLLLWGRETSKTSLTTYLAQGVLEGKMLVVLAVVLATLVFCKPIWEFCRRLMIDQVLPVNWLMVAYLLSQNPWGWLGGFLGAAAFFGLSQLMAKLWEEDLLDSSLRPLFVGGIVMLG